MSRSFYINTTKGIDLVLISHEVRTILREVKSEKGMVLISIPFPGAGLVVLTVNGVDSKALTQELEAFQKKGLLSCFLPCSLTLPVDKGKLTIDPWQDIYLIDYESSGKRREFQVKVQGEGGGAEGKEAKKGP